MRTRSGSYVPPDGRLVRTDAAEEKSGGMFSKPSEATLQRLFALPPDAGPAALQGAIEAATRRRLDGPAAASATSARLGSKQLSTGKATMSVGLITDAGATPENVPPPVLSIALQHVR